MLSSVKKASQVATALRNAAPAAKPAALSQSLKSARHTGTFGSLYKGAVLSALLSEIKKEDPAATTFVNLLGGGAGSQIKISQINRDAVLLHRWLRLPAGMRRIPQDIDSLKPYLRQFEAANHNVAEDEDGFPKTLFLPSENAIAYSHMGPMDRAIIHDDNAVSNATLAELVGTDRRVQLRGEYPLDQDYTKKLFPLRGRGLLWFDLGHVPTYSEQLRTRNLILETLKTQPQAVIGVCYPAPGGKLPWQLFDALTHAGLNNIWNCVHYSDDAAVERAAVDLAASQLTFEAEVEAQQRRFAASGSFGQREGSGMGIISEEMIDMPPVTLMQQRPNPAWEATGITLVNAPQGFERTLEAVGSTLKEILGKPNGYIHKRLAPVHAEPMREYGESFKLISYSTPGFAIGEEFQKVHASQVDKAYKTHFTSDAINVASAMDDTHAPATLEQIVDDAFNPLHTSQHTKDAVRADSPEIAAAERYVNAEAPMERIVGDLELYQLARNTVGIEVARQRALDDAEKLRRN